LVGVRVENLTDAGEVPRQLTLGEPEAGWREAEQAMDKAAQKFGRGAIRPAALMRPGREQSPVKRVGERRDHSDGEDR
jgi:DNA polymerase-4